MNSDEMFCKRRFKTFYLEEHKIVLNLRLWISFQKWALTEMYLHRNRPTGYCILSSAESSHFWIGNCAWQPSTLPSLLYWIYMIRDISKTDKLP